VCARLNSYTGRMASTLHALTRTGMAAVLALSAAVAMADDEESGALMGDLMFHADLMSSLDAICPARARAQDWQAVVRELPPQARTGELRTLSRRLSADASQAMVRGSGGCGTRQFAQAYAETRRDYEQLLEQWARLNT
jgi:hypothetical protein